MPTRIMSDAKSCCGPSMPAARGAAQTQPAPASNIRGDDDTDMVLIPGGAFRMGCDRSEGHPSDGEGPSRLIDVAPGVFFQAGPLGLGFPCLEKLDRGRPRKTSHEIAFSFNTGRSPAVRSTSPASTS